MSDNIHLVPVKAKDLDAVYALLAGRNNGGSDPGATEESVEVPRNGSWSRSDLADLFARCFKRNRAIITRVATSSLADEEVSYHQLEEAARPFGKDPKSYDFNNLRADLAWIAKFSKKVKGERVWPMTVRESDEPASSGDRYLYRMPKKLAAWWLELAEA